MGLKSSTYNFISLHGQLARDFTDTFDLTDRLHALYRVSLHTSRAYTKFNNAETINVYMLEKEYFSAKTFFFLLFTESSSETEAREKC